MLSDEIYSRMLYEGGMSAAALPGMRGTPSFTASKIYAMTGWRLAAGYFAGAGPVVARLTTNKLVHRGVHTARRGGGSKARRTPGAGWSEFRRRRDVIVRG